MSAICSVIVPQPESKEEPKFAEIAKQLEAEDLDTKINALKRTIQMLQAGHQPPRLLMTVIKSCLHSEDHTIKKLLCLFWEVVQKKDAAGKLVPEMILVCNSILRDLKHPNEYVRGSTLRLLCTLNEQQILHEGGILPAIVDNLTHGNSYVRKNALLAVFAIYSSFPDILPDAPQLVMGLLESESNPMVKRNAFLMLFSCDAQGATVFLHTILDQIQTVNPSLQLVALEVIRRICREQPLARAHYMRAVHALLQSASKTVSYEAANTLLSLSGLDAAVHASVGSLVGLLNSESDHNVKLVILNRLSGLISRHKKALQAHLIDILRALPVPNADIQRSALAIALECASPSTIDHVVSVLKKEVSSSEGGGDAEATAELRTMLVQTLHQIAVKFPGVATDVVPLLLNFVGAEQSKFATEVVQFVREIVEEDAELRDVIVDRLLESLREIRNANVLVYALWILGEYGGGGDCASICATVDRVIESLGSLAPGSGGSGSAAAGTAVGDGGPANPAGLAFSSALTTSKVVVLEDGTYATQEVSIDHSGAATGGAGAGTGASAKAADDADKSLRGLVLSGLWFLACHLAVALAKLVLRLRKAASESQAAASDATTANQYQAKVLLTISSMLRFGRSPTCAKKIDQDSFERLVLCCRALLDPERLGPMFIANGRSVFREFLKQSKAELLSCSLAEKEQKAAEAAGFQIRAIGSATSAAEHKADPRQILKVRQQVDQALDIRQLRGIEALGQVDLDQADDDESLQTAQRGRGMLRVSAFAARLERLVQLTGASDPVYAEAVVTVDEFDLVLDTLVINQTDQTLQNLQIELSTSTHLRVVDPAKVHTLVPGGVERIKMRVKVSATESGHIFGSIVYDSKRASEAGVVLPLNSIDIDVMDYIKPAPVSLARFNEMWAEFEWENKIPVATSFSELAKYLDHVQRITNSKMVTSASSSGAGAFLSANLYAKSIFGEHAVVNVSVELSKAGLVEGAVRVRTQTQGIALALGDKITTHQKET